jgi:hypothetical protein
VCRVAQDDLGQVPTGVRSYSRIRIKSCLVWSGLLRRPRRRSRVRPPQRRSPATAGAPVPHSLRDWGVPQPRRPAERGPPTHQLHRRTVSEFRGTTPRIEFGHHREHLRPRRMQLRSRDSHRQFRGPETDQTQAPMTRRIAVAVLSPTAKSASGSAGGAESACQRQSRICHTGVDDTRRIRWCCTAVRRYLSHHTLCGAWCTYWDYRVDRPWIAQQVCSDHRLVGGRIDRLP